MSPRNPDRRTDGRPDRKPARSRPGPSPRSRLRSTRGDLNEQARVTYIDYKDTDLLRKFISDRGRIRSRRVTRVSAQQQRRITAAIESAREMALLPYGTR
ncbi:30S ribosomal protein S18 [Streptomyces sp. NBC_01003]|uniref:30S ribosomal protein S18 n=1 Tax=Streptomyces sp. NBC_01003 TaxID=2903714 RepID=UPI0038675D59|nr:30S ribosomal protein S18 [Streptomyces sp. NBC_01003]